MTVYSLKAACTNCNRYGTINDVTLICQNCGASHSLTDPERQQRDSDMALHGAFMSKFGRER